MTLDQKGFLGIKSSFFKKKEKSFVGIDIGSSNLKIVRLAPNKETKKIQLTDFANIAFEEQVSSDQIKKALEEALRQTNISKDSDVVFNIPNNSAITRYVVMPKMNHDDLRKAIGYELEKYIAFDTKEAVYDFRILENAQVKEGHLKVLLVITKKETVDERVKAIEDVGFIPKVVSIDSVVISNTFYLNHADKKDKNIAIVNLGSRLCSISVVRGGISNFMRDIAVGIENIVSLVSEKLEMNKADILNSILKPELQSKEFKDIINSVLSNLLNELYLSFDYYETQFETSIDEIYITGGLSQQPGLIEFLSNNLGITVNKLNPLQNLDMSVDLRSKLDSKKDIMAVSIGLALEDSDLKYF
ncbi:MAG: type IV pilus assembly protein PilM [Candidatus Gygaella obscura]|nr:type IV pilus assembly protein PilM [Candidatus Gygaella obscura]